jgi:hypothetical protein
MADFNGRIEEVVRVFQEYPAGDINTRITVRQVLARERDEGFQSGYSEGRHDQREAYRCSEKTIGPPLDEDDRHPEGDYDLWHMAVYIPAIPCGSEEAVAELLAANGIETYRMWPVENPKQMKAAMDEFEGSLKAKDGTDA